MANLPASHRAKDTPFYYTEECGLALLLSPQTGRKLAIDKSTWGEVVAGLRAGMDPGSGGR